MSVCKIPKNLSRTLGMPISTAYHADGRVESFYHTDARALDPNLSSTERAGYQALELARHWAKRNRRDDDGGETVRPKTPVLSG